MTTPTKPTIPVGTPQSLALEAAPTTVPYAGALVHVRATVTVEPGARFASSLALTLPGVAATSLVPLRADGTLDEHLWIVAGGDLIARAGSLERRVTITQTPAPEPPAPAPPTCNGGPWPCPKPAPLPEPIPTPPVNTLALKVSVDPVAPATTLRVNQNLTFSVTVDPLPGDPVLGALTYDWIVKDGFSIVAAGSTNPLTFKLTHTGPTSAGVTVSNADGRQAYGRIEFTIVP